VLLLFTFKKRNLKILLIGSESDDEYQKFIDMVQMSG
jgi:hypothetical protein